MQIHIRQNPSGNPIGTDKISRPTSPKNSRTVLSIQFGRRFRSLTSISGETTGAFSARLNTKYGVLRLDNTKSTLCSPIRVIVDILPLGMLPQKSTAD